jgi:hypothetical protein
MKEKLDGFTVAARLTIPMSKLIDYLTRNYVPGVTLERSDITRMIIAEWAASKGFDLSGDEEPEQNPAARSIVKKRSAEMPAIPKMKGAPSR